MSTKHYRFLERVFAKTLDIDYVMKVLYWGRLSEEAKVERMCTLQEIRQELLTSEIVGESLVAALDAKGRISDWEVANLHHMSKIHRRAAGVPVALLGDLLRAKIECRGSWKLLRSGDIPLREFMEKLEILVKLSAQLAALRSEGVRAFTKYDVLLSSYDDDLTTKKADEVFTNVGAFLQQFLTEVVEKQSGVKVYDARQIAEEKQKVLSDRISSVISAVFHETLRSSEERDFWNEGFFERASCVTDYSASDYKDGIVGLMKSAGQFLYGAGLPKKWKNQPVGSYSGSIMYEAQGLFMSRHLMQDKRFISFVTPLLKKSLALRGRSVDCENIYLHFSRVCPNALLQGSDEVTSLAHVMLRYTLEKEMINDELQVKDLPEAWMQGMQYYFGIVPKDEKEGFAQDYYWPNGLFGYLPCVVFASIAAAQLFSALGESNADAMENVAKGDFSGVLSWLSEKVYAFGAKYSSVTLLKRITGRKLDVDFYKDYLTGKYLGV